MSISFPNLTKISATTTFIAGSFWVPVLLIALKLS